MTMPRLRWWCDRVTEATVLAMACLSPWAFGAMEAWAEEILYLGVVVAALSGAVSGLGTGRARNLVCAPSLVLVGLIVLALGQAAPLSEGVLRRVAPSSSALRAAVAGDEPGRVRGDSGPPVEAPALTISQHREMTADVAARLAAAWVLFQAVLWIKGGEGPLRRFGLALAANATLLALFSLVQSVSWNGKMYWVREVQSAGNGGPFVSHNHLAAYLNLGLGFALISLVTPGPAGRRSRVGGPRLSAAYASGLIAVAVIASLSRGGFLGMLTASLVMLAVFRPVSFSVRAGAGLAAMLALAAVFLSAVGVFDPYRRLATFLSADSYVDRFSIWSGALRAWSSYPVWGLGLGSFSFATARFFGRSDGGFYGHAEDEYIEILTEGGVVGLALALLALASVIGLGRRALRAAPEPGRRAPVAGALFGVVALATQCLSDFPMHITAVSVTALALAAHLARVGLDARAPGRAGATGGLVRWVGSALAGLALVAVSLLALGHGREMARAEAALVSGGVPPAGFVRPTTALRKLPMPELERVRDHLERSLRHRPDCAEGHARLGLILVSQYRAAVLEQVAGQVGGRARAEALADPLWLHGVVHTAKAEDLAATGGVLAHEPVVRYLVPAARSFLEARRCCPVWGLPHAELAALDYLLLGGEAAPVHARRALRLAGPEVWALAVAAAASAQAGDRDLAARCWRRMLQAGEETWTVVADQAGPALAPEQLLERVIPDGRYALWFSDRLYAAPEARPTRDRFLRAALDRLPHDPGLPRADRLRYEAEALARLDEVEPARSRMAEALRLEPRRGEWRREFVDWLIGWGRPREAHDLALIGLHLAPGDPDARRAVERAAEALSGGPAAPAGHERR
jgi:O-antigen ligase